MVGDTWSPTVSMRTLKYFLADETKQKARVNQLDCIGALLQAKVKYTWWTIALCLVASVKKYFKVLMEAVGDQVSTTNSLFYRSPLTTILNLSLSRLPSDFILYL